MDLIGGQLVISPTDVVGYVACAHLAELDLRAARGEIPRPEQNDPMLDLLRSRGLNHEHAHLERLQDMGLDIVDVAAPSARAHAADGANPGHSIPKSAEQRRAELIDRRERTVAAMRDGSDVVYQATFFDESADISWQGHADFLRRVTGTSAIGDWRYEPEDTKLSRHVSPGAVLQLCFYADMVEGIQGAPVDQVRVALGDGQSVSVRLPEVSAYFRTVRSRFVEALRADTDTYPLPTAHCGVCRWTSRCQDRWEADDHLTRVAFLTVEQSRRLEGAGIGTLTALADSPADIAVAGIGEATLRRLKEQASLQKIAVKGEAPPWRYVLPVEEGLGLAALPEPSAGDIFYDIEGHPYAVPGGLEYLHGVAWLEDGDFTFEGWWAFDEVEERRVFEQLIDFITTRRAEYPDMHVYHYAPYEKTAIGRMMGKYVTREDAVDDLLRNEVFVDLYRVVRQGIRVGTSSYSIKKLEPLYMAAREDAISDGGLSIVAFETWLHSGDQSILNSILEYNKDDVLSNYLLREWLEDRRTQLITSGIDVPRRVIAKSNPETYVNEELAELIRRLNVGRYTEESK